MSIRTERVAGEIQKVLSNLFQRDYSHLSSGMLTVTLVRMSPDLRSCRVYLSILGGSIGNESTLNAIKLEAPHIRSDMGKSLRLRHTPELFFFLDDTQEEVSRIEELFKKIHEQEKPDGI
ncbi:MAG: 30S ribosome-binding factor RbfA [Ignavibacteriota bacterium]